MGFFHTGNKEQPKKADKFSVELLHRLECKVCPLNGQHGLRHPNMEAWGSNAPVIYMLGTAPGKTDDRKGRPFSGPGAQMLRSRMPKGWDDENVRWNNCVRTTPPDRPPADIEIECCRPSIVRDIEKTKPPMIFGFGNTPLQWATGMTGINKWSGRRIPIRVGTHTCWFYPMMDPDKVLESRRYEPRDVNAYGSEDEFLFALQLQRAFDDIDSLPDPVVHDTNNLLDGIELITGHRTGDMQRVKKFMCDAATRRYVGFDYETKLLRPFSIDAKILSFAVSHEDGEMAVALEHSQAGWSDAQLGELQEFLCDWFMTAECVKIVHNLAFEMEWSAFFFGVKVLRAQRWEDTASQAYILDERMKMGKPDAHSLEFLCMQYFGINLKAVSNVDTKNLDQAPLDRVLSYNGLDARYHRLLFHEQKQRLLDEGLLQVYRHHLERVPTMVLSQIKGVPINVEVNDEYYKRYSGELQEIEKEIAALPIVKKYAAKRGTPYRPSANADVKYMVTQMLGETVENVDEKVLSKIDHPVVSLTLKWRGVSKLLSTYILPVRVGSAILIDGKVHPIISTIRTRTWRTSSEDPNIQNWPKRKNKHIRRQVCPGRNLVVVSFDYGQIQARNIAMESLDKAFIKSFWERHDIHADWMNRMAEEYPQWVKEGVRALKDKDVSKVYRHKAKNEFVFPSFFGARPKSLSGYLGIPEAITESLQEELFAQFPEIHKWQNNLIKFYKKHGYVTGLSGFRRRAPISPNELINAPIQADEALMVCDAMSRLSKKGMAYQANMEIHDDLTFIMQKSEVDRRAEVIIREMLRCPFKWAHVVPIVVEMSVGDDWANQKEVGVYSSDQWLKDDPLIGSWQDGTGWANSKGMEKARGRKRNTD